MVPMNCTLMPVCSSRLPSLGRTVTAPLTDSPSMYSGAFSRRFLSSLTSTMDRSSASSRTISMSTGVAKKYDMVGWLGGITRASGRPLFNSIAGSLDDKSVYGGKNRGGLRFNAVLEELCRTQGLMGGAS